MGFCVLCHCDMRKTEPGHTFSRKCMCRCDSMHALCIDTPVHKPVCAEVCGCDMD